jgi:hypothetical protein
MGGKSMRRSFTPFPGPLSNVVVAVEASDEGGMEISLTEQSSFGNTSLRFNPDTARQIASTLLRAATAAESGATEEHQERKSRPKLAAMR